MYRGRLRTVIRASTLQGIEQKLADNALRRKREALLSRIGAPVQKILTTADYLLAADIAQVAERWFWPSSVSPDDTNLERPASWVLADFDNLAGLARAAGLVKMPAIDGYLWLDRDSPIFMVDCDIWNTSGWHIMDAVCKGDSAHLAIVASDNSRGILISEYVGYLPKERQTNRAEIVYDLVTW